MSKLDAEQDKERDELFERGLLELNELSRQHMERSRRRLMAIPDDVWNQAMANDAAAEAVDNSVTQEKSNITRQRPHRCTNAQLSKVDVEIVDEHKASMGYIWLRCKECGKTWSPNIQPGGRMPDRYWHCPNGCNHPDRDDPS